MRWSGGGGTARRRNSRGCLGEAARLVWTLGGGEAAPHRKVAKGETSLPLPVYPRSAGYRVGAKWESKVPRVCDSHCNSHPQRESSYGGNRGEAAD